MIAEAFLVQEIRTLLPGADVYFGAAPQEDADEPQALRPTVIVNRIAATFPVAFCGTDPNLSVADFQVDSYARTSEEARRTADAIRLHFCGPALAANPPGLSSEASFYDEMSRAWRVMQTWRLADYSPAIP